MEFPLLLAIVLVPMLGAVINGLGGCFFKLPKSAVKVVAVGSVATSFAIAVYAFISLMGVVGEDHKGALTYHAYEWFSVFLGERAVPINVSFSMDALSGMMTVMITGIGTLIHVYSTGYMSEEPSYARFFAYLNLFMASMLILVLASNMPLMFVGWEGVGLCSYLLIGFWFENPAYAAAGKKAFIVNRIGDFGVLMGMFLLMQAAGSFEFADMNAKDLTGGVNLGRGELDISIATLATLFLFLGCAGKSAQIPLYVWLPDAMAGPTPVSALIHAATMVTSGIYLCCRVSPVLVQSPTAMAVIAIVGTLTALLAASIALVQNQLKKVLAYSTVSQLGFMFAAVGVGAFGAGIFHVFTHAFFKACLFLGAGSVMHAVHAHGDADLNDLGGMKKWMPITEKTFLVSCAAIAGFPLTSGFFSKDMILHGALGAGEFFTFAPWLGYAIFGALCLGAFGTAFYMFRLYFLTFTGEFRGGHGHGHGHDDHAHGDHGHGHAEPHESEWPITVPLMVLGAGAVLVGFLGMPAWTHLPDTWSHWLEGVLGAIPGAAEHHHDVGAGMTALIAGSIAGLGGIALAYVKYCNKPWHSAEHLSPLHQLLMDKWRVDELYDAIIIRPTAKLAEVSGNIDRYVVDGATKLLAYFVQGSSWLFTRLQNGLVHTYGTAVALGLFAVTVWVLYPHIHVETAAKGDAVHFVAGAGLGYEYRWDFDSDGKADTEWGKDKRDVSFAFDPEHARGVEVVLTEAAGRYRGRYTVRLEEGEQAELDPKYLGDGWRTNPHSTTPPHVALRKGQLLLRPGASTVEVEGTPTSGEEIPLPLGAVFKLGEYTKLRVDTVVASTLEVKNVFGNVSRKRVEVVVTTRAKQDTTARLDRAP
jgi:NADH-quinone oxidoreductase subunit L